ncbi:hypothetical protein V6N13_049107 [Hibiscus sabdariffa]
MVRSNICWSIGSVHDVDVWFNPWISDLGPLVDHILMPSEIIIPRICVANMASDNGEWQWDLFQHLLDPYILLRGAATKSPNDLVGCDVAGWTPSSTH